MRQIRVKRKGYRRKDGTYVHPTTYLTKDKGATGKTPKAEQWYEPKKHTGWRKAQSPSVRRRKILNATDKRLSLHSRYVQAGRMAQSLANVSTDRATKEKARADAIYFFRKAKK